MSIDKQAMTDLVSRSADRAQALLLDLMEDHDPFDAMVTTMLAVAVLAKSIGMPRETLREGVGAAFDSLLEATPHATH
jgi:DNA-binding phage protein